MSCIFVITLIHFEFVFNEVMKKDFIWNISYELLEGIIYWWNDSSKQQKNNYHQCQFQSNSYVFNKGSKVPNQWIRSEVQEWLWLLWECCLARLLQCMSQVATTSLTRGKRTCSITKPWKVQKFFFQISLIQHKYCFIRFALFL